ncbi:MAG TPA: GNAT family N-acetyltransferase [Ruminococcaceae bacterium]|nr:GNAT family N-acetyltransferase [Oscillospiraceae bacterium]
MDIIIREYSAKDIAVIADIWNEVVEEGNAFPQTEGLSESAAADFFSEQSFTGVTEDKTTGEILGIYILHPNNIGRCGHISNASYAVKSSARGLHIGEKMVRHCIVKGKELGFKILQFNAVVKTNYGAVHLYEKLGFVRLGNIPGGFLMKDGSYEDIILFYLTL